MPAPVCAEEAGKVMESTGCVRPDEEHVCDRPLADAWIPEELLARAVKVFSERYGQPVGAEEAALMLGRIKTFVEIAVRNGGGTW